MATRNHDNEAVTRIDAMNLDDDQFDDLMASMYPARSILPILTVVLILLVYALFS